MAHALYASYVFEGMRALLAGQPFPGVLLLQGSQAAAIELLLVAHFTTGVYRHAVRRVAGRWRAAKRGSEANRSRGSQSRSETAPICRTR